jgi:hypothetical protein
MLTASGMMGTFAEPLLVQVPFVTATPSATVPPALAEKVIAFVLCPPVIVPFVMVQKYDDAPAGTEAVLPVDEGQTLGGAVMVTAGAAPIGTLAEPLLEHEPLAAVTPRETEPLAPAVKVMAFVF